MARVDEDVLVGQAVQAFTTGVILMISGRVPMIVTIRAMIGEGHSQTADEEPRAVVPKLDSSHPEADRNENRCKRSPRCEGFRREAWGSSCEMR